MWFWWEVRQGHRSVRKVWCVFEVVGNMEYTEVGNVDGLVELVLPIRRMVRNITSKLLR